MITDDTTYRGRTLGQWVEMAKRSEAEIVRLAGELYDRCSGNDLPAAGAPDLRSAILPWESRLRLCPDSHDIHAAKSAEIADLRAALASAAPVEALTDREILDIFNHEPDTISTISFARAIEARIMGGAK